MKDSKPFAEVVESSLAGWIGQTWQWDVSPAFGSLVCVSARDQMLFGVVYQVQTGSIDPMRHTTVYQKTEEELRAEQPQIFALLKTTFSCLVIGYQNGGHMYYLLPDNPAKIHAFIEPASKETYKAVFAHNHYLPILFNAAGVIGNFDELLLSIIRHQAAAGLLTAAWLEDFIGTFSLLIGNDYRRLKSFLQRVQVLGVVQVLTQRS